MLRPDGTELVMEFMGKGALCGEAAAFDGLPRFSMATVLEDATLVALQRRANLRRHPRQSRAGLLAPAAHLREAAYRHRAAGLLRAVLLGRGGRLEIGAAVELFVAPDQIVVLAA